MSEWLTLLTPFAPYLIAAVPGLLVGWTMVQLVKAARRERKLAKLSNSSHRLIAMGSASCGSLIGSALTDLENQAATALAALTGLLCPMFWGLAIRMTKDAPCGWRRSLHWYLRGNRRQERSTGHSHQRHDDDGSEDTWGS